MEFVDEMGFPALGLVGSHPNTPLFQGAINTEAGESIVQGALPTPRLNPAKTTSAINRFMAASPHAGSTAPLDEP